MDQSWEGILEKFRIEPPSEEALYFYLMFGIMIIGLLILWEVALTLRRKRKLMEWEWRWFHKMAEAKDLSEEEASKLVLLAQYYFKKSPQKLLHSIQTFDESVKKFLSLSEVLGSNGSKEETAEILEAVREKYFFKDFHANDNLRSTRQIPPKQSIRLTVPTSHGAKFLHTIVTANTTKTISLFCEDFSKLEHVMIPGAHFTGYYWREKDAGYHFPLSVKQLIDSKNVEFKHSEDFSRKQRRHFYRVNIHLTGRFFKISEEDAQYFIKNLEFSEETTTVSFLGKIVSLSGGGISFFTDVKCENDAILRIEILGKKGINFKGIIGRIVRIREVAGRTKVYVEFLSVTDLGRDAIVQFVSKHQRVKTLED
ncbi:PilZ domain-containing protein [candidate division KSB1 bacterium]|nr:PilZ domain-containing protein [candidate division KSB1 bacterium]